MAYDPALAAAREQKDAETTARIIRGNALNAAAAALSFKSDTTADEIIDKTLQVASVFEDFLSGASPTVAVGTSQVPAGGTLPANAVPAAVSTTTAPVVQPAAPTPVASVVEASDPVADVVAALGADIESCPDCNGPVWDNRDKKKDGQFSAKSPDFSCRNKSCGWAHWLESFKQDRAPRRSSTPSPAAAQVAAQIAS